MRILLSCLQSPVRHAIPAYDFWRNYFVQGLAEAGHEAVEVPNVDWAEGLTYSPGVELDRWRAGTWEAVNEFVRRERAQRPIDLFLGYLYPKQIEVAAIREMQGRGIPCVNYFCDNVREFTSIPAAYAPFDLHWVPEYEALPMYRRAGLPHIHAAMPCWVPPEFRDVPATQCEPPTFIGSADELRADLIGRALNAGADFIIRGAGWKLQGKSIQPTQSVGRVLKNQVDLARKYGWRAVARKIGAHLRPLNSPPIPGGSIGNKVSDTEYVRLTRESMVTIGINRVSTPSRSDRRPLVYSRLRDIEAPMLAACYLTEWTSGLEHMYELGTEIETYRTPEELSGKLDALRHDPARRMAMRASGQRRALADHSISRSIERIRSHFRL